jgi:hypothetical protein
MKDLSTETVSSSESFANHVERRRYPRTAPEEGTTVLWPTVVDVELLDVSVGGASFSASEYMRPGQTVHVRTVLAGVPFSGKAQVLRAEPGTQMNRSNRYLTACRFSSLDDKSKSTLMKFLGQNR